jgi:glutamate synthase (NADPH) small chain
VLREEGISFECGVDVGRDVSADELRARHDALVIAIGSRVHRDLEVPGRELDGVHFAMDYLYQRNRHVAKLDGRPTREAEVPIVAEGKHVVVVGGGDTGMDCISNAIREGARDVKMLDVYPELPPSGRPENTPWPLPPKRTLTTYALDEGGERQWNAEVIELLGEDGRLARARARLVEGTSSRDLRAVPGSEFELPADLVLIAIGFSHPEHEGAVEQLSVRLDARGNVKAPVYETSAEGVFACGDARVGQSLIVTAIAEGRKCARMVDRYLGGEDESQPDPFVTQITDAHFLELEAQTAGTVTVGDEFFSGAGETKGES